VESWFASSRLPRPRALSRPTRVAAGVIGSFLAALFRFPVSFAGYESGWSAVPHVLGAVLFYGVLGGFFLLALLGAIGGAVANLIGAPDHRRVCRWTVLLAIAVSGCAVLLLATLDFIIGPW
jgi:hypothetical protein